MSDVILGLWFLLVAKDVGEKEMSADSIREETVLISSVCMPGNSSDVEDLIHSMGAHGDARAPCCCFPPKMLKHCAFPLDFALISTLNHW